MIVVTVILLFFSSTNLFRWVLATYVNISFNKLTRSLNWKVTNETKQKKNNQFSIKIFVFPLPSPTKKNILSKREWTNKYLLTSSIFKLTLANAGTNAGIIFIAKILTVMPYFFVSIIINLHMSILKEKENKIHSQITRKKSIMMNLLITIIKTETSCIRARIIIGNTSSSISDLSRFPITFSIHINILIWIYENVKWTCKKKVSEFNFFFHRSPSHWYLFVCVYDDDRIMMNQIESIWKKSINFVWY